MGGVELPELPLNVAQVSFMRMLSLLGLTGGAPGRHDDSLFPPFFFFSDRHVLSSLCCFETLFVRYSFTALKSTISFSKHNKKPPGVCGGFLVLVFRNYIFTGLSQNLYLVYTIHSECHLISHDLSLP